MKTNQKVKSIYSALMGLALGTLSVSPAVQAEDAFWTALTEGKPDFSVRLRYENVDDDQASTPREANANTARITLGYKTGSFHNYGFYGQ